MRNTAEINDQEELSAWCRRWSSVGDLQAALHASPNKMAVSGRLVAFSADGNTVYVCSTSHLTQCGAPGWGAEDGHGSAVVVDVSKAVLQGEPQQRRADMQQDLDACLGVLCAWVQQPVLWRCTPRVPAESFAAASAVVPRRSNADDATTEVPSPRCSLMDQIFVSRASAVSEETVPQDEEAQRANSAAAAFVETDILQGDEDPTHHVPRLLLLLRLAAVINVPSLQRVAAVLVGTALRLVTGSSRDPVAAVYALARENPLTRAPTPTASCVTKSVSFLNTVLEPMRPPPPAVAPRPRSHADDTAL